MILQRPSMFPILQPRGLLAPPQTVQLTQPSCLIKYHLYAIAVQLALVQIIYHRNECIFLGRAAPLSRQSRLNDLQPIIDTPHGPRQIHHVEAQFGKSVCDFALVSVVAC